MSPPPPSDAGTVSDGAPMGDSAVLDGSSCTCVRDADCGEGLVCDGCRCVSDAECVSGLGDAECPGGQICLVGVCTFLPPDECTRDEDCPEGEACTLRFCEPATRCRITRDCGAGEVCVDGFCRIPIDCRMDSDCAAG